VWKNCSGKKVWLSTVAADDLETFESNMWPTNLPIGTSRISGANSAKPSDLVSCSVEVRTVNIYNIFAVSSQTAVAVT
jgi:hypothetical protein